MDKLYVIVTIYGTDAIVPFQLLKYNEECDHYEGYVVYGDYKEYGEFLTVYDSVEEAEAALHPDSFDEILVGAVLQSVGDKEREKQWQ